MTQQPPPASSGSSAAPRPDDPHARLAEREEHLRRQDADLLEHDLSDHDESIFHRPARPWRHLSALGATLLVAGALLTGLAAAHLSAMSAGTIANAVLLPDKTPVNLRLAAGEQREFYAQRTSGEELTRCTVVDGHDEAVPIAATSPVILQGSDVLWHGQSIFTAPRDDDYTVTCSSVRADRLVRVGRVVGLWDVVLTLAATGGGGIAALSGLGLLLWGRGRRTHDRGSADGRPAQPGRAADQGRTGPQSA